MFQSSAVTWSSGAALGSRKSGCCRSFKYLLGVIACVEPEKKEMLLKRCLIFITVREKSVSVSYTVCAVKLNRCCFTFITGTTDQGTTVYSRYKNFSPHSKNELFSRKPLLQPKQCFSCQETHSYPFPFIPSKTELLCRMHAVKADI